MPGSWGRRKVCSKGRLWEGGWRDVCKMKNFCQETVRELAAAESLAVRTEGARRTQTSRWRPRPKPWPHHPRLQTVLGVFASVISSVWHSEAGTALLGYSSAGEGGSSGCVGLFSGAQGHWCLPLVRRWKPLLGHRSLIKCLPLLCLHVTGEPELERGPHCSNTILTRFHYTTWA